MSCKICGKKIKQIFNSKIIEKYDVSYFKCSNCGFIQTKKPVWLKEAYSNSITNQDTGLIERNVYFSKIISPILKIFFKNKKNYLDYAGGHGVFTRLMRNKGFKFYWDDKYTENLFAKGFEYKKQKIDLITCFECFEHFQKPIKEIEKMLKISKTIIFSTRLIPKNVSREWDYFGFEHGQHIAFYSKKTLEFIAKKYGLELYSFNNFHIFTNEKINFFMLWVVVNFFKLKIRVAQ
jgi:hypothetical protein